MSLIKKLFFTYLYFKEPPWDTNQTPPELHQFIQTHAPGKALDLGCGTGTNAITLAKNGWQVTGIDFVRKPIRMARQKAQRAGVTAQFQVGDVTRLDHLHDQFDLILDIGCFHSLSDGGKQAYRQNIQRLLAPEGTFLLYAFFKASDETSVSGLNAADLDQFATFLKLWQREDGTERGIRQSAWLTYRKPVSD